MPFMALTDFREVVAPTFSHADTEPLTQVSLGFQWV